MSLVNTVGSGPEGGRVAQILPDMGHPVLYKQGCRQALTKLASRVRAVSRPGPVDFLTVLR